MNDLHEAAQAMLNERDYFRGKTDRHWAYCWTEANAGPFVQRLDGQQTEARLYGYDYAWWKWMTGIVRWDLLDTNPYSARQWRQRWFAE